MHIPHQTRSLLVIALLATSVLWSSHAMAQTAKPVSTTALATAARTAELSTFYKLVQQAGLTASLETTGPVTVFAPTNEAFKAMPPVALDKLGRDPDFLKSVLTHHVVPRAVKAADISAPTPLMTLNGAPTMASKAGDFVTVDEALVTQADLIVGNGVVHLIDRVLMPAVKK